MGKWITPPRFRIREPEQRVVRYILFYVQTLMKKENEIVDNVMFTLESAQESLKAGAVKQAEFFLASLHRTLEAREEPKFQFVIDNICRFFDDANTTYTKMMETMSLAQCEIMRLTNELADRAEKDDPTDQTMIRDTQEFFFQMNLLLWNLKPIAMYMERQLQEKGSEYVGYTVKE